MSTTTEATVSINSRIIRDSLMSVLTTVDAESDPVDRYVLAKELKALTDDYLSRLMDRTAYDGAVRYGVKDFAVRCDTPHSAISKAATKYSKDAGVTPHATKYRMAAAPRYEVARPRRQP